MRTSANTEPWEAEDMEDQETKTMRVSYSFQKRSHQGRKENRSILRVLRGAHWVVCVETPSREEVKDRGKGFFHKMEFCTNRIRFQTEVEELGLHREDPFSLDVGGGGECGDRSLCGGVDGGTQQAVNALLWGPLFFL